MSATVNNSVYPVALCQYGNDQNLLINVSPELSGIDFINFLLDLRFAALKLLNETMEDARRSCEAVVGNQATCQIIKFPGSAAAA